MQRFGFIHGMMDVKVLALYVFARVDSSLTMLEAYELCYQDDCVSYFDVCTAIDEMVKSGHLSCQDGQTYSITEKGRRDGSVTEDSIAYTVRMKAAAAAERFNQDRKRSRFIRTEISQGEDDACTVTLRLNDEQGMLMNLQLASPNRRQAKQLCGAFQKNAELFYNLIMSDLLEEAEGN